MENFPPAGVGSMRKGWEAAAFRSAAGGGITSLRLDEGRTRELGKNAIMVD